jgi:hypothetical protein
MTLVLNRIVSEMQVIKNHTIAYPGTSKITENKRAVPSNLQKCQMYARVVFGIGVEKVFYIKG